MDNSGINQLIQHATSKKHNRIRNVVFSPGQSKRTATTQEDNEQPGTSTSSSTSIKTTDSTLTIAYDETDVIKAETVWALKVASSDMSYRSCDGIGATFESMFHCPVSKNFQLSRSKVSYVISDGLGPYFQNQLIYDVNSSKNPVTLHYDETTTTQVIKQMDLHFRFWSEEKNEVVKRFYTALMFGHAEGAKVAAAMVDKLEEDKVNLSSILTLSSDGPNVNKTIFRAVNTSLKVAGNPGMINIGTCNLHVVHNSFCKALEAYDTPVDDLAVDIHSFFKISSARREDFKFIQLEEEVETHTFLRHVPSRWLTLGPVVDRLIEQWEPLQKYFTDLANKDPKSAPTSSAFKRSCTRLQNKQTLVELHFLKSVMPLYHSFFGIVPDRSSINSCVI